MGVSESTVRRWIKAGMPLTAAGKVDEVSAARWVENRLDAARRAARMEGDSGGRVTDLRARKLEAEAALLEMQRQRRAGELLDRKAVEETVFARARMERDMWLAWSARTAATLAAETGADPSRLLLGLDREVRAHLLELSETPLSEPL
jgi:hypothetical protein